MGNEQLIDDPGGRPYLLDRPDSRREGEAAQPQAAHAPTERGRRLRRVLVRADLLALAASILAASLLSDGGLVAERFGTAQLIVLVASLPMFVPIAYGLGLYHVSERHLDHTLADELGPVFMAATAWSWALTLLSGAFAGPVDLSWFAALWGFALVGLLVGRGAVHRFTTSRAWYKQNVMLLGDRVAIEQVLRRIRRHPECGVLPIGAIMPTDDGCELIGYGDNPSPELEIRVEPDARPAEILELTKRARADRVFLAGWGEGLAERTELIRLLSVSGVYVDIVPGEPEALCASAAVHHLEGLPIMTVHPSRPSRLSLATKRAIDVVVSGVGLAVLSPLFLWIAVRIKLDSKGPVLFRQPRSGLDGRTFEILKFRTMVANAEDLVAELRTSENTGELFKLRDDPRITKVGSNLRARSFDELPQLWNVLIGDMSLVGPRPLPLDEAPYATGHFADRATVRPGITGPWQIHGRSDIPFEDMVKLDYSYVRTWSLREDLHLLIRTVGAVATSRGAY